jgi:hypothetical protein
MFLLILFQGKGSRISFKAIAGWKLQRLAWSILCALPSWSPLVVIHIAGILRVPTI